jgi:type IV secretory pathway TraG/TraD family ATPase VirD4
VDSVVHILMPTNPRLSDPFFEQAGRAWLRAVTLHVMTAEPRERRTLPYVRQLIKAGDREGMVRVNEELVAAGSSAGVADPYQALIGIMKTNHAYDDEIALAAVAMEAIVDTGTGRSIRQVVNTALEWIGKPSMAHILGASTFSLFDLKRQPTTIYLSLPTYLLRQDDRAFLGMVLQLANMIVERDKESKPKHRPLLVIDEFSAIGYFKALEDAFVFMRGLGVSINAVVQDVDQLRRDYQGALEIITASCEVIQMMATNNVRTAEWMSAQMGNLMTPDEILRLPREETKQLIFVGGDKKHRLVLDSLLYDKTFPKSLYDRDPANPRSR